MPSILETELAEIEQETQQRIRAAKYRADCFKAIEEKRENIKSATFSIKENPRFWHVVLPRVYAEGKMDYSPRQFQSFSEELARANEQIDKFVGRYLTAAEDLVETDLDKVSIHRFKEKDSIVFSSTTFALPNFINYPLVGKEVNLKLGWCDNCHVLSEARIAFDMIHTGEGVIRPFYYGIQGASWSFEEINKIAKEINAINPPGFVYISRRFREGSYAAVEEDRERVRRLD